MLIISKILKLLGITKRATMESGLKHAANNGLRPRTVIDVGVAHGTIPLYEAFPDSKHLLIEPLREFTPLLDKLISKLKDAEYVICAASSENSTVTLNVHPDLVGSSLYLENEESGVNGYERKVEARTLDTLCQEHGAKPPYLLKIDTQGSELDVLKGAENILKDTELIILETSMFNYFNSGGVLHNCINFMLERGFVTYDIFDLQYRLLDGALSQIDIAFAREDGILRKYHYYATKEQREKHIKHMTKDISSLNN